MSEITQLNKVGTWNGRTTKTVGDYVTGQFVGTSVGVLLRTSFLGGVIEVYIDDVLVDTISTFGTGANGKTDAGATNVYVDTDSNNQKMFVFDGLNDDIHTIKLLLTDQVDLRYYDPYGNDDPQRMEVVGMYYGVNGYEGSVKSIFGHKIKGVRIKIGDNVCSSSSNGHYWSSFNSLVSVEDKIYEKYEGEFGDIILTPNKYHSFYGKIIYPTQGQPCITEGIVVCKVLSDLCNGSWKVKVGNTEIESSPIYKGNNIWELTIDISSLEDGVYNLMITHGHGTDIRYNAIKKTTFKNDYWVAVIDSLEERYTDYWETHGYSALATLAAVELANPEFVLVLGDNIANPYNPTTARNKYVALLEALRSRLSMPTFIVPGNHDIGCTGEHEYLDIWQEVIGSPYHSFTYGNDHFVQMNTGNLQRVRPEDFDPEQIAWVQNDLDTHQDKNLYLFRHVCKVGYYGESGYWRPLWERDKGVKTVIYGHYGQFEDLIFNGVRYIQTDDSNHGNYTMLHFVNGVITEVNQITIQ